MFSRAVVQPFRDGLKVVTELGLAALTVLGTGLSSNHLFRLKTPPTLFSEFFRVYSGQAPLLAAYEMQVVANQTSVLACRLLLFLDFSMLGLSAESVIVGKLPNTPTLDLR